MRVSDEKKASRQEGRRSDQASRHRVGKWGCEYHAAMRFAVWLAVVYGVGLPVLETWRRWGQLTSGTLYWPSMLDDWILGVLLLAALWVWRRNGALGRRCLIGAWGCVCGVGYPVFFGHLREIGQPDPSGVPHGVVVIVIGVGWVLAFVALLGSVFAGESSKKRG